MSPPDITNLQLLKSIKMLRGEVSDLLSKVTAESNRIDCLQSNHDDLSRSLNGTTETDNTCGKCWILAMENESLKEREQHLLNLLSIIFEKDILCRLEPGKQKK